MTAPGDSAVPPTFPREVRALVATSTSGLSNRLLTLAGSLRIARALGREFRLHWPRNAELDAAFGDLFENPFPLADEATFREILHTESRVTVYQTDRGGVVNRAHYRSIVPRDDAHIVVVKGWGLPALKRESHDRPKVLAAPILRELVPVAEIRALMERHAPPPGAVGVHIRRGDTAAYFARSKDEHFLGILRAVVAERPDVAFFLCTDDEAAEEGVRRAFPDRVHALPKRLRGREARGCVAGMREAVADLFLLARTRAILGNHRSSFSATASLMGPGRLVVADEESAGRRLAKSVRALVE